jgi:pantoate kinase
MGKIENIAYPDSLHVVLAGAPGLRTSEVLTNPATRERINAIGDDLVTKIISNPTIETFLECSREFSEEIGLKTTRVRQALNDLDESGHTNSSMVMLGDSVFCFCDESGSNVAQGILSNHWDKSEVSVTRIAPEGGRLLK